MASTEKRRRTASFNSCSIAFDDIDPLLLLEIADALESLCSVNPFKNVLMIPMKIVNSNAAHSRGGCSFSKAYCDVTNKDTTGFYFVDAFRRGLDLLLEFIQEKRFPENKKENFILNKLLGFLLEDDVIADIQELNETELTSLVANHLFGKLATTANFVMDANCAGKRTNQCLCGKEACYLTGRYGDTSVGNVEVWHGNLDIIVNNDLVLKPASEDSENPGGKSGVKLKSTSLSKNPQIIAETIVFSFLQKQNHPERDIYITPCVGVGSSDMLVMLYDAEHDVLLESSKIPLISTKQHNRFNLKAVIVAWLTVNYKFLCTGLTEEMKDFYKADFFKQAKEKLDVYEEKLYMGNIALRKTSDHHPQYLGLENPYMLERRKKLKEVVEEQEEIFSAAGFSGEK